MAKNGKKNVRTVRTGRKKKRSGSRLFVFIVLILCCSVISVTMVYLKRGEEKKLAEKQAEVTRLEQLISEENERSESIAEYKAYVQTTSYIEEVAREILGLVYKDEVIFVPKSTD